MLVQIRVLELENKLSDTQQQIRQVSDGLSLLMGQTPETFWQPTDALEVPALPAQASVNLDSRPDILAMKEGVTAREHLLQATRGFLYDFQEKAKA